ncbi:hypothetical protein [Corynebacterium suicordis]
MEKKAKIDPNKDLVGARKQQMAKNVYGARTVAVVGLVSLGVGLFLLKTPLLSVVVPVICLLAFVYFGVQIKKILDHKDEW